MVLRETRADKQQMPSLSDRRALIASQRRQWLAHYTWTQEDGTIDFSQPRPRPTGLDVTAEEQQAMG